MDYKDKDIESTSQELIGELSKPGDIEVSARTLTPIESDQNHLRKTLFSFFDDTIKKVDDEQSLMKELKESFHNDVAGNTLDFNERMSLYQMLASKQNNQINSILSLFKPAPGAPSMLADNVIKEEKEDKYQEVFNKASTHDLQNISKLVDYLQMNEKKDEDVNS